MKTKWQRQIGALIVALKQGATKCEHITGRLFYRDSDGHPQACALGMIYVDGKNVARIRSISFDKLYKEHPVLKTVTQYGYSLYDQIITLNDSEWLTPRQIVSWLRKLARRKTAPKYRWPIYGMGL